MGEKVSVESTTATYVSLGNKSDFVANDSADESHFMQQTGQQLIILRPFGTADGGMSVQTFHSLIEFISFSIPLSQLALSFDFMALAQFLGFQKVLIHKCCKCTVWISIQHHFELYNGIDCLCFACFGMSLAGLYLLSCFIQLTDMGKATE